MTTEYGDTVTKRLAVRASRLLSAGRGDEAEDVYAELEDMVGVMDAARRLVDAELGDDPVWSEARRRRLARFALQRCYEVGDHAAATICETVGFAVDMRADDRTLERLEREGVA